MGVFLSIFKNDLRIVLRDVKALLLLLIMPVIVIMIMARALTPLLEKTVFIEPFDVAVVDEEQSMWTGLLAAQLKNLGIINDIRWTDEKEARELIAKNEIAAAIVIPPNLSDSIDHWEPVQGKVIGNSSLYLESRLIKNIAVVGSTSVSAGLAALNAIYDYEYKAGFDSGFMANDINQANESFIEEILARKDVFLESTTQKPEINPLEFYAASLIAVFVMFSSIPCIKLIAEERKLGILSRIRAAPAHDWQTIGSKLILSVLISVVQFSVIAVFLSVYAGSFHNMPLIPLIGVLICTIIAAAAFSLLVASIATSAAATDLIANLSILLMAIAGGSIYPLSSLPDLCKSLSVIAINRWSAEGFMTAMSGGGAEVVSNSCFMLLLLAVGYGVAALLVFKLRRRRAA